MVSPKSIGVATLSAAILLTCSTTGFAQGMGMHRAMTLPSGSVIPVLLNNKLSSETSRPGDHFTATVESRKSGYSRMRDMRAEGIVLNAAPKDGRKPGILNLEFRRLVGPHGRTLFMHGGAVALDGGKVDLRHTPYRVKPGYTPGPMVGSSYKILPGTKGHDITLGRGTELGFVVQP